MEPSTRGHNYNETHLPKAQISFQKRGQNSCNSLETCSSLWDFSLWNVRNYTFEISLVRQPKHELYKDINRHANMDEGNPRILQCYTTMGNQGTLIAWEIVSSKKGIPIRYRNHMVVYENIHTNNIIYPGQVTLVYLRMYIYLYV